MKCVSIRECPIRISLSTNCVQFIYCIFSSFVVSTENGGAVLFNSAGSLKFYHSTFYNISAGGSCHGGAIYSTGLWTNSSFCCYQGCKALIGGAATVIGNNCFDNNVVSTCYSTEQDSLRISSGYHHQKNLNSTFNSAVGDGSGLELSITKGTDVKFINLAYNTGSGVFSIWVVNSGNSDVHKINLVHSKCSKGVIFLSNSWTVNSMAYFNNTGPFFFTGSIPSIKIIECSFDIATVSYSFMLATSCQFNTSPILVTFESDSLFQCEGISYPYSISDSGLKLITPILIFSLIIQ